MIRQNQFDKTITPFDKWFEEDAKPAEKMLFSVTYPKPDYVKKFKLGDKTFDLTLQQRFDILFELMSGSTTLNQYINSEGWVMASKLPYQNNLSNYLKPFVETDIIESVWKEAPIIKKGRRILKKDKPVLYYRLKPDGYTYQLIEGLLQQYCLVHKRRPYKFQLGEQNYTHLVQHNDKDGAKRILAYRLTNLSLQAKLIALETNQIENNLKQMEEKHKK